MKIAYIEKQDIDIVQKLLAQLYLELGEEKESLAFLSNELIEQLVANGLTTILKSSIDDEIVGILTLTESQAIYSGGKFGSIDEMYVKKTYRSKNIGQQLVRKAIEIAKEKGWNRIGVTAPTNNNEATLKFYKKNGFVFTGAKLKLLV